MPSVHVPVLLNEVVRALGAEAEGKKVKGEKSSPVYLDGTLGGAGHALAIAGALNGKIRIVGLDRDPEAIRLARETLAGKAEDVILENEDYRNLDRVLDAHDIGSVDLILLDLGMSSDELEHSGRGFSFKKDEPLLMTFGDPAKYHFTAQTIVNDWDAEDIANVIFGYGEERYSRRIAKSIVEYRGKKRIETSGELADIVRTSVPVFHRRLRIHPATKTFQALRIAVNDELGSLREGLAKGYEHLVSGGRMAVISFHSLEDRIVKDFFRARSRDGAVLLAKKPVTASPEEAAENPRAGSAKLRFIEKRP